jgi:hypothetical protein
MAVDARKRQKKLERRKAKEKAKRKLVAQRGPRDLATRLQRASAAPILHCRTTNVLWDQGMGNVVVSRELASGNVAYAVFLLDVYCLGVKDVMFNVTSRSRYDWQVVGKLFAGQRTLDLEPEAVRKLIEGGVDYARDLGLAPHPDYRKASLIFGDIDAEACDRDFVYGKDGKPLFIAGPHDSRSRCERIIQTLNGRCGPDGFDYLMQVSSTEGLLPGAHVLAIDDDEV